METHKASYPFSARMPRHQRGASLLEGIAYLGIAAIIVLGAVSLLTSATSSAKANQMSQELIGLRTAVKKLHMGQSYPVGSLLTTVTTAQAVPSSLIVSGTTITNAWGGTVTIDGLAGGTTFSIVYPSVPQDVCINVLSGISGWTSVKQGAANITTFPLTSANALTVCSAASNSVTFTSN